MADSEGTFGGNGSVYWMVAANNVKQIKNTPNGNSHTHEGHCGTPATGDFTIQLFRPAIQADVDRLVKGLEQAITDLNAGALDVTFPLAIEQKKHRQIVVNWQSAPENFMAKP